MKYELTNIKLNNNKIIKDKETYTIEPGYKNGFMAVSQIKKEHPGQVSECFSLIETNTGTHNTWTYLVIDGIWYRKW